ncbi:hypothetical protein NNX39_01525 [Arthrobacter sp. zg-Y826]|uniref:hypothetical protein n=1 Tax=Arthrobacter jinronghuae TaxID=2964609 RepID=UPI0021033BDF|nr:hypothetical protein [Arthrobacter jinronghuae]MCQ1955186.1 hypothetical protein [Arthrobacter jinronghuae]
MDKGEEDELNPQAEGNISADPPKKPSRSLKSNLAFWGILPTFGLLVLALTVGPWVITSYDDDHRVRMECTVTDAEGGTYSPAGRSVGSRPELIIRTSDCGTLSLIHEFDQAANEVMAAELAQGGRFEFELGQATRTLMGFFDVIGMTPVVSSYEKVD